MVRGSIGELWRDVFRANANNRLILAKTSTATIHLDKWTKILGAVVGGVATLAHACKAIVWLYDKHTKRREAAKVKKADLEMAKRAERADAEKAKKATEERVSKQVKEWMDRLKEGHRIPYRNLYQN